MGRSQSSIIVQAERRAVWDVCADPAGWIGWYDGLCEVGAVQGWGAAGATFPLVFAFAGVRQRMHYTVLEWEPPRRWVGCATGAADITSAWDYEPVSGGTRVTGTVDYRLPGGLFGGIADRLFVARQMAKTLKRTLRNIKHLAERPGPGSDAGS